MEIKVVVNLDQKTFQPVASFSGVAPINLIIDNQALIGEDNVCYMVGKDLLDAIKEALIKFQQEQNATTA